MGKVIKESLLTTFFSYIGVVIGYFNMLWLLPYALEPDQMGLFKTIQDMALLLVSLAQLGLGNGITRYYPKIKDNQFAFFTMSLFLSFIGFLLITFLLFIFKSNIISAFATNSPEVIDYLGVVLLITFFSVLNTILDSFCRSFMKIAVPSFFRDVFLRILISILVGSYFMEWISFQAMMWGLSTLYFITLFGMGIFMFRNGLLKLNFNWKSIPKAFKKEFLGFSLITLLGATGALLISKIDSLMVTSMIGLDANAIYSIGFAMAIVIEMPRRAISQVVMPIVAEKFALNQLDDIDALYKKVAINQLVLCLLIFLLIWANVDNFYYFVPNKNVYEAGKWVVLLIGLGKLSDVLFSINGEIIIFSRFYIFNITATLLMSVTVITLNFIFIPLYGIEGAALASLIAMFFFNLIKYLYVKIRLGFDPFTFDIAKIIFLGILVFTINYYLIPKFNLVILDLIVRVGFLLTSYLFGIWLLKIAPESQRIIMDKIGYFNK
ncbi:MAG: oligosaccharide flippase family protein [Anditalea sp.]